MSGASIPLLNVDTGCNAGYRMITAGVYYTVANPIISKRITMSQFLPGARLLLLCHIVFCTSAFTQEAHLDIIRTKLTSDLEAVIQNYEGVAGLHVIDLASGDRWAIRDDLVFPQASAIKVPILLELFRRGDSDPALLRRRVEMTDDVRTAGSGVLQVLTDGGSALSLEDYAIYMILHSDNTATNVLIDELGMDAINRLSASLGATQTLLQRKMIRPEQSAMGNENLSTPRDAAMIMEKIATCELPMSAASCQRVREILELYKDGPIRTPVPRETPVAFKPGGITGVSTVWGIIDVPDRPYVLVVMSNYGGNGGAVIERISALTYDYFSRLSGVTEYGTRVPLEIKRRVNEK
jgi:beta-lactamase class A